MADSRAKAKSLRRRKAREAKLNSSSARLLLAKILFLLILLFWIFLSVHEALAAGFLAQSAAKASGAGEQS